MSEAIEDQSGGLAPLGLAYLQRRYALLFYSLLITSAAAPLFASIGFDTDLIDWFLAVNLLAAALGEPLRAGERSQLEDGRKPCR